MPARTESLVIEGAVHERRTNGPSGPKGVGQDSGHGCRNPVLKTARLELDEVRDRNLGANVRVIIHIR